MRFSHCPILAGTLAAWNFLGLFNLQAAAPPAQNLNTPRTFPKMETVDEWRTRADRVREQVLLSCGLWPLPERTPLEAKVFGKAERDGYTVEKVYFQTYPHFYLAGNLYRPLGRGPGPFPAILNPHGHWANGRMADTAEGSIAARCISFARQGMIAFSYDMVGYNDTIQIPIHRQFALDPTNQLWSVSLMGLQTWNSIRALDFLETLDDVDKSRLACTGESGGGTQTFMLGAADGRLAAQAPIVMVSHSMQGGCLCENAPGLRVDFSNMEIAAVPAPRPQILVGATGDWTRALLDVEGPAIARIYELFKSRDKFDFVRFDFNHNYNQTSREAVYRFFEKWLHPTAPMEHEQTYRKDPDAALRVFPNDKLPDDALPEPELIGSIIRASEKRLDALWPSTPGEWPGFQKAMLPAWHRTMQISDIHSSLRVDQEESKTNRSYILQRFQLGRSDETDRFPALLIRPLTNALSAIVVLAHPKGESAFLHAGGPAGFARKLLDHGKAVLLVDVFQTGSSATERGKRDQTQPYFSTYNRTDLQERVGDLAVACEFARTRNSKPKVILCGIGRAGLWSLMAAPAADAVAADANALSVTDKELLAEDLFAPGLRRIGTFEGPLSLLAPNPLYLFNAGEKFPREKITRAYAAAGSAGALKLEAGKVSEDGLAKWIGDLNFGEK